MGCGEAITFAGNGKLRDDGVNGCVVSRPGYFPLLVSVSACILNAFVALLASLLNLRFVLLVGAFFYFVNMHLKRIF